MYRLKSSQVDPLEVASRIITLATLVIAIVAAIAAPLLAISWSRMPFPGFLIEPTFVANSTSGAGWSGYEAGIAFPHRVVRVGGSPIARADDLRKALAARQVGQRVSVFTVLPDGSTQLFPSVILKTFRFSDLARLFWLPYLVGLVYLVIGVWMFRIRGHTRPGRAFAFFCFCTAVVCILLFDLGTTHVGAVAWTAAIAQTGGALISLALRFPEEWRLVQPRPWLLALPYGVSILIAAWGILGLSDMSNPWAYVDAWGASYRYTALGIVSFLSVTVYRALTSKEPGVRQQARIVLLGGSLAFIPITVWFVAPLAGASLAFDAALFLPSLLIFPLAVAIAIRRYRLLQIEVIVNRTIFYGALTAVLAGTFTVLISVMQRLFIAATGEKNDAAIVLTTLLIVAVVDRIRSRVQRIVDRQFKEAPDATRDLRRFADQMQSLVLMTDATQIAARLLDETAQSLRAQSGAVSLLVGDKPQIVHTVGRWTGEMRLRLPLENGGRRYGFLLIGPRRTWEPYTRQEVAALQQIMAGVARSIGLALTLRGLIGEGDRALPRLRESAETPGV